MAECIVLKGGGGGTDLDVITADASDVTTGKVIVDKDGNPLTGTLPHYDSGTYWNRDLQLGLEADNFYSFFPVGRHAAFDSRGSLHRIPIARLQTAIGATPAKILSGQSVAGVAGSVNVQSILSFSAAVYSSTAITFTWKNPAKGPYSGVIIVGKTGSYPASITDGTRYYKGAGNNSAASGTSSATVSSFASGTTYYFRVFSYAVKDGAEWVNATTYTATVATTKGQQSFTSSGTFTIPAGVRSIDVFCVGGGGGGAGGDRGGTQYAAGGGGGSGYTATQKVISVTPGQQISIIVGSGGPGGISGGSGTDGGTSYLTISGTNYCTANGGKKASVTPGGAGGSGGGGAGSSVGNNGGNGGSNGSSGGNGAMNGGAGQGTTTRAFGESANTLYAGGGGGGGNGQRANTYRGLGGSGGGGNGADALQGGSAGSANTGGGGGGGYQYTPGGPGFAGGSGICLIRWGY